MAKIRPSARKEVEEVLEDADQILEEMMLETQLEWEEMEDFYRKYPEELR